MNNTTTDTNSTTNRTTNTPKSPRKVTFTLPQLNVSSQEDETGNIIFSKHHYPRDEPTLRAPSTYSTLPSGRLMAGSKRVTRAKEAPAPEIVVDSKDLRFGGAGKGADQGFAGFVGVNVDQASGSKH
ncbi:hypothetical protein DXG01_008114 [Tephrocybe rancida]|nr:hypothetical protein DXG01_008114 [Tephrocybe rancida]